MYVMNKTCYVTGHTKGIGQSLYNHFVSLGWQVTGYNSVTGLSNVIKEAAGCDLFINNAYANGVQIDLLNQLYDSVGQMIVCGSIVTDYPDPMLLEYTKHKQELEKKVLELSPHASILLLKLSGHAYNNPDEVIGIVDYWLANPTISVVSFKPIGEPNR
jgi:hypothetical protein